MYNEEVSVQLNVSKYIANNYNQLIKNELPRLKLIITNKLKHKDILTLLNSILI